jgi:hypothetical protein
MDETAEPPKETILKSKEPKAKKQLTDEARAALAMRMRAINDKRILDAAEKIKKEKPPAPTSVPVPEPTSVPVPEPPVAKKEKKKRVIKVIELSDSETEEDEPQVIAIKKSKPKKPIVQEHLDEIPVRKPRAPPKPKTPKEPSPTVYQMPEPPRGRFL